MYPYQKVYHQCRQFLRKHILLFSLSGCSGEIKEHVIVTGVAPMPCHCAGKGSKFAPVELIRVALVQQNVAKCQITATTFGLLI